MTASGQIDGSIRVGLGRSNVVVVLAVAAFLAGITVAGIAGSVKNPDAPLGFVIGGLFGLVLVYFLVKIGPLLRPRAYEFGRDGLRFWHGKENVYLPWSQIAAIGVGYEAKPEDKPEITVPTSVEDAVKERVQGYLKDQAMEVLHVSDKRRLGLEVYPVDAALFDRQPRIKPYVKQLTPPGAPKSTPQGAWRLPLPPVIGIAQEVGRGVQTYAPRQWLGWYARRWAG